MPTPAKKAAPRVSPKPPDASVSSYAKDSAIDLLLRKAFPHGAWAHVSEWLENQNLAPEVRAELEAAVERSR